MKRKSAKEILAESFQELAAKRDIDRITVRDIAENSGYSTATFYRHFKDKYDLIAWDYAGKMAGIMGELEESNAEWSRMLLEVVLLYQKEQKYLANLLKHTEGHDSFIQYMTQINQQVLTAHTKKMTGLPSLDKETDMYIHLYCVATVCMVCEWLLGALDVTAEELARIFEQSVPQPLGRLLLQE